MQHEAPDANSRRALIRRMLRDAKHRNTDRSRRSALALRPYGELFSIISSDGLGDHIVNAGCPLKSAGAQAILHRRKKTAAQAGGICALCGFFGCTIRLRSGKALLESTKA